MTWMPTNNPPMQPGNPMMNPWLQLGLGILSNNRPGSSVASAVGRGAQSAMQNMAAYQQWQEQAEYRKLQAEQMKEQIAAAKEQARKDAEMQAKMDQYFADNPDSPYASIYQFGGQEGVAKAMMEQIKAQYDQPTSFMEWTLAGKPGSYEDWLMRKASAGGTKVEINNNPFNPLQKGTTTELEKGSIAGTRVLGQIDQLIEDTQALPSGVGGIAQGRESIGGVFGQLADIGIPGASSIADAIRPESEVFVPSTGETRTVTPQTLITQSENLTIALKPLMADSGPLSNQDRQRLSNALGDVATADSRRRIEALKTIRELVTRNKVAIDKYLRASGAGVPGELPPTREDLEFTAQKYGITVEEVQRRLLEQQLGR